AYGSAGGGGLVLFAAFVSTASQQMRTPQLPARRPPSRQAHPGSGPQGGGRRCGRPRRERFAGSIPAASIGNPPEIVSEIRVRRRRRRPERRPRPPFLV